MKMNRWKRQSLKLAGLSASVLLFAAACGETGSEGNLRFLDETGASDKLILPVAEGRTASYTVKGSGLFSPDRTIEAATSSDETVAQVVSFTGATLKVKGLKPGSVSVEVLATDGSRDLLKLEVREEETSFYRMQNLGEGTTSIAGLVDVKGKYNIHTGDTLNLDEPVFVDSNYVRLSGAGPVGLGEPEVTGSMSGSFSGGGISVDAGVDGDTLSYSNPYGSNLAFRTKDTLEPATLEGAGFSFPILKRIGVGTSFVIPEGIYTARFVPVDADGYAYVGSHDLQATAVLSDVTNLTVTFVDWSGLSTDFCAEQNADEQCVKWEGLPAAAFTIAPTTANTAGSGKLTITVGSVTQAFSIDLPAQSP